MNDRIFGGDIFADVEIYFTDKYLLLSFYSGRVLKKSFYGFFNYDLGFMALSGSHKTPCSSVLLFGRPSRIALNGLVQERVFLIIMMQPGRQTLKQKSLKT